MVQKTRAGEYHEAESKEATAQPVEQNYRQDSRRTEGPKPGYELEGNPGDNFYHDEVSRRRGSFVFLNRSARGVRRRSGSTPYRRVFTYPASSGLATNSIFFCFLFVLLFLLLPATLASPSRTIEGLFELT